MIKMFFICIFLQPTESVKESTETEQKIVKDLSKLSKREKIQVIKHSTLDMFLNNYPINWTFSLETLYIDIVLIFFHILVLREHWVLE